MPKKLPPVHPGEILAEELREIGITKNQFAKALRVPSNRISAIINGKRRITGETALRLARYFGTSSEMWINLQARYDLEVARDAFETSIAKEIQPRDSVAA
jgi:addiction module HigA family antidote